MKKNEYQKKAMTTCMPSSNNFAYMFYGLLGEVGELVEKISNTTQDSDLNNLTHLLLYYGAIAKKIRKEPDHKVARMHSEINTFTDTLANNKEIMMECGDIEWMMNGIYSVLGWSSETVHQENLNKLASRQQRGKIDGDGDNR